MVSGQKIIFNNKQDDDFIKNFRVNYFLKAANNSYWACTLKGIYLLNEDGEILNTMAVKRMLQYNCPNQTSVIFAYAITNCGHLLTAEAY
jgi:hypothetical protein